MSKNGTKSKKNDNFQVENDVENDVPPVSNQILSDYHPNTNDDDINDFGYLWSIFKNKPSKISFVYSIFDGENFWALLKETNLIENSDIIINGEVILDDDVIHSYKYLIKLEDDIYISFYEYIENDNHKISNLVFFYNNKSKGIEDINDHIKNYNISSVEYEHSEEYTISYMSFSQGNLEIEPLLKKLDYISEDFYDMYPSGLKPKMKKMIKKINDKNNGLYILHGDRGVGKTSFIGYAIDNVKMPVILIPYNIVESFVGSLDFIEVLKQNPNTLYIIDDADGLFMNMNYLNGLIQVLTGIFKNSISCSFLISYNSNSSGNIPKILLDNSNLTIKFGDLSNKEIKKIQKLLDLDENTKLNTIGEIIEDYTKTKSSYF